MESGIIGFQISNSSIAEDLSKRDLRLPNLMVGSFTAEDTLLKNKKNKDGVRTERALEPRK